MIPVPSGVRVWLATGHTDIRKGVASLSLQVQEVLRRDPLSGHLFCLSASQAFSRPMLTVASTPCTIRRANWTRSRRHFVGLIAAGCFFELADIAKNARRG